MDKATSVSALSYLMQEKKRLISELNERIEDLEIKRKSIERYILDRIPPALYPDVQNYIAYINTEKEMLEKHKESVEKWNLSG